MQYSCRKAQFDVAIQVGPPLHLSDLQRFSMRKGNPLAVRANGCTSPLCTLTPMGRPYKVAPVPTSPWHRYIRATFEPASVSKCCLYKHKSVLWDKYCVNIQTVFKTMLFWGVQCLFKRFFFSSILQSLIRMVLIVRNQLYCMKEYAFWI